MDSSSGTRLGKLSPGVSRARPPEAVRTGANNNHGLSCMEREGKKKGRPRAEVQELRNIPGYLMVQWKEEFKRCSRVKCPCSGCWLEFPSIYGLKYHYQRCQGATLTEKLNHSCQYCEAVFATKVRLQKHKLWNHPERVTMETRAEPKLHTTSEKGSLKKRPIESRSPVPVFFKVKKSHEASQNGEVVPVGGDRKQPPSPELQSSSSEASPKSAEGSDSEDDSPPPSCQEEDPERMRHRRKQKTPKKFTGEQPSISGTFGLKGMNKVEEKLKAGKGKRVEEPLRKLPSPGSRKDPTPLCSGQSGDAQWHHTILERGEVVCPTCSIITRKTVMGLKKHMEICQKLQDALKCQQCQKQFRSKAGLNYHTMAEHNKGCPAHLSNLIGYQDHQKRCTQHPGEEDRPVFLCPHCGRRYRSKAGRDHHARSEHPAPPVSGEMMEEEEEVRKARASVEKEEPDRVLGREREEQVEDFERTPSGRVRRRSAQVAVFHLQEIAEDELAKEWGTRRRIKDDLVPDTKRLNYTRPGLPKFSPKLLEVWKSEVKERGFICCPNGSCEAVYSSVSGLKAHLANCNKGEGAVGKYRCLLCQKEFSSESGVKYHISKSHAQNWFRAASHAEPASKSPALPTDGPTTDLKNGTARKKRGRKPKGRPPEAESETPSSTPACSPSPPPCPEPAEKASPSHNRHTYPSSTRRGKTKKTALSE